MKSYKAIGIMSGTSLDGLDIAYCNFELKNENWNYDIIKAETSPYDEEWENKLRSASNMQGRELIQLHAEYGKYIGQKVKQFISKHKSYNPGLISSHGHTVYHQPDKFYTFQIGHPAAIAAETRKTVVADFRSLDIALGGQGAPLVPIGDILLFTDYDFCLNLGGFANISYRNGQTPVAFDVCPANFVINKIIKEAKIPVRKFSPNCHNSDYLNCDPDGFIASKGKLNMQMLDDLNEIEFYNISGPKSLGEEWVIQHINPILQSYKLKTEDALNTFYHHIVMQIHDVVEKEKGEKILVTGGGAFNKYLIKLLRKHINKEIVIPPKKIIEYKEALIFAFLGVLRINEIENSISSVTGSISNSIGGCVYLG